MTSTLLTALLIAAGIFAALIGGQWLAGYAMLRRMRFGPGGTEAIPREDVPEDARRILDHAAPALAALGFEYNGSRRVQPLSQSSAPVYGDYYRHAPTGCHAFAQMAEAPEPGATTAISFQTFFDDGRTLITVNRRLHQFMPMPPEIVLEDGYLPSLEEQWALHRQRVETGRASVVMDKDELLRRDAAFQARVLDCAQEQDFLRPVFGGLYRMTPGGAWRYLRRLMAGNRRVAKLPRLAATESADVLTAADLHAYHAHERVTRQGAFGRGGKVLLFAASAAAGAVAFGLTLSWEIVPLLAVVILFHEFGHALAMRLTGYRNIHVLVLPFLGAVAAGRKDDAGPWTRLAVLLAGPLPGLLLAVICLRIATASASPPPLLLEFGYMALLINLFNLLPFTPLDGGQIVETFVFSRWPRLRFAFFAASGLVMGALGLWLNNKVLLAVPLLLAIGARPLWQRLRLAARVGPVDKDDAPRAILTALHGTPALARQNFHLRLRHVRAMLPLVAARPARLWESAAGLAIYGAVIALPLASLNDVLPARQILQAFAPRKEPAPERNWEAELAKAKSPGERWSILYEAGSWQEDAENEDAARRYYEQALTIAQGFPPGDLRLLDSRLALARFSQDALPRYRELLGELRALQGKDRTRLADALEAMHWLDTAAPPQERIARLREAIAIRDAQPQGRYLAVYDRRELAALLYRQGNAGEAEKELRRDSGDISGNDEALVWLLIDQGRAAEAETLASRTLAQAGRQPYRFSQLQEAHAWALLEQGKTQAALDAETRLYNALPAKQHWNRIPLLLDLLYASRNDPAAQARWTAQIKEETAKERLNPSTLAASLHAQDEMNPWQKKRTTARLATLNSLGLPEEQECKQGAGKDRGTENR